MDVKEIDILGDDIGKHWYYASKAKMMRHLLTDIDKQHVLDVGAGSGFFSKFLLECGDAKEAWCIDTSYEVDWSEQLAGKQIYYQRTLPSATNATTVLLMDVLEHVDDDQQLLRDCLSVVPEGGHFLISVPAFQFLWSGHDVFLEHKRRYTLSQLCTTVEGAGLIVKQGAYGFGLVFPIAATTRLFERVLKNNQKAQSQLMNHHPLSNQLLNLLCGLEIPLMRWNKLAGLSVFCLAQKP